MGTVKLDNGVPFTLEEVDGDISLQQLYEDAACEQYTDTYRAKIIRAWGKLSRNGWAILPILHDLVKSNNEKLSSAAKDALKRIDPGAPLLSKDKTTDSKRDYRCEAPKKFQVPCQNGYVWKTLEVKKVTLTDIPVGDDLSEGTRVTGVCSFCTKHCVFPKSLREANDILVGSKKHFCSFCLSNEFYKPYNQKNTLILSFRGLIGYYYYCFHALPNSSTMYMTDLEGLMNLHAKIGIQNPIFRYDSESYLWFVDFSKVGNKPRQFPLKSVLNSVVDILFVFNLYEYVQSCSPSLLFKKFKDAITDFHHHRRRPEGQQILTPTLYGCGIPNDSISKGIPFDWLKTFVPSHMIENYKRNKKSMCM